VRRPRHSLPSPGWTLAAGQSRVDNPGGPICGSRPCISCICARLNIAKRRLRMRDARQGVATWPMCCSGLTCSREPTSG
jgi:hypothetical protein